MLKIRANGDMIVDELVTDAAIDGLKSIKTIKCPNLYGTAFEVWESQDLATIFGTGEVLEPEGITTFTALSGHNYYDTYTGTITVGADNVVTITNTGESAVTVYVVDLTTLFTTEPNETQMDDMTKMFLFNGTGSELITLESVWYVDYAGQVIHNLTTIYGAGNEPTLATHESLIPQYTNTVLKAKAFANTLQQEYMQISLDTPVYEGLSLRDIFEDNDIGYYELPNGVKTFEISGNDLVQRVKKYTLLNTNVNLLTTTTVNLDRVGTQNILTGLYHTNNDSTSSFIAGFNRVSVTLFNDVLAQVGTYYINSSGGITFQVAKGTYATLAQAQTALAGTVIYYQLATPIVLQTFTTSPTQTQLDEWLDIYLTLTSNNAKTGTEFYQDRYYVDYDNAKVYDYEIISPYVSETPADKEAFMAQVIAKTVTLTNIPVKAKIYKDRFVILGDYIIIGE